MKQMGFQPGFKLLASREGEPEFRNELQQLDLQEKQSELQTQEKKKSKLNYLVATNE